MGLWFGLRGYGLEIVGRIPIEVEPNECNAVYLATKRDKLGHLILRDDVEADLKIDEIVEN